jgi:phage gp36-like protein
MPYCTLDDIKAGMDEDEIIRYTDDSDTGAIDTGATDKAIARADALIDAHIAARYTVPVTPVPDMLNAIAVDIVIYQIYSRRGQAPDEIRTKYDDAVKFLEKVSAGRVILPMAASAPESRSSGTVAISTSPRIFSRDTMKGF